MGLRSMLFAVGLGTLWGGCKTGLGKLPDSKDAVASFSPDGREIYLLPPHRLYVWDLDARRIVRDRRIAQAEAGISFSPGGAFVVLAMQEKDDRRASVVLLRTRDGEVAASRELLDAEAAADHWYTLRTGDILSATDDGRWLAAYRLDTREVEIGAVAPGGEPFRAPLPGYFRRLAFNARGDRLFASSEAGPAHSVLVFAASAGRWALAATIDGAFHPQWTEKGLAFATGRGIEIRDGAQTRLLVAKDARLDPQSDAAEPGWRVSPDAALCVAWNESGFAVRETASGATLVVRDVDTGGTPAVWAIAFLPGRIRALLATGELIDVDPAARSISVRASFGRPGRYTRNWLQDGASWEPRYSALLSPNGRYVALFKRDAGYELFLTQ